MTFDPAQSGPWVQEHYGFSDTAAPRPHAASPARAHSRTGGVLLVAALATGVLLGWHGPSTSPVSPGAPPVPVTAGLLNRAGDLVGFIADDPGPRGRRR